MPYELILELFITAAANDGHFFLREQCRKRARHVGLERRFALGKRAVEIKDYEGFFGEWLHAFYYRTNAQIPN